MKMTVGQRAEILGTAMRVFCEALLAGWANSEGQKRGIMADGEKVFEYVPQSFPDFKVVDRYYVSRISDYSFGTTIIFWNNDPIWMMSYQGRYPKEVIHFLKEALRQMYVIPKFFGGRGPRELLSHNECLIYQNNPHGTFESFHGCEDISKTFHVGLGMTAETPLGYHKYLGSALI